MLAEFVTNNRSTIITRTRARVARRASPAPTASEVTNGIPAFLDHLVDALRLAESTDRIDHSALNISARRHGGEMLETGLSIAQVVHDYGDVCQVITALAMEQAAPIPTSEFRTLNLCLDDAIAEAVTEHARLAMQAIDVGGSERLGILAHEMRTSLSVAMMSFEAIRSGSVAIGGSTGLILARSLTHLRDLIELSLADVRLDEGLQRVESFSVAAFVNEIEIGALMKSKSRGLSFSAPFVDRTLMLDGDRQILLAAIVNLLDNAFKFTRKASRVSLKARVTDDRVVFDVEDECGGLPPGRAEELFRPFEQRGTDRSGVGLGLSICRKAARAHGGELSVRDLPGKGCVFTLEVPQRHRPSSPQAPSGGASARGLA